MGLTNDYQYEFEEEKKQTNKKSDKEEPPKKPTKTDVRELNELITKEETDMSRELFKRYVNFQMPTAVKAIYTFNDRKKNNELVNIIKSGLSDLKNEIERMSEGEIKIEKPYEIVDIVEKILEFNKQNQQGQGLKILTPNQMLSRLPISLAQLKAGNNSEKLKNEIRQLLYSLYRSKKLTKKIYNNLINTI